VTASVVQIVYLQAMVRGFLERRKYKVRVTSLKSGNRYFKDKENKETLDPTNSFVDIKDKGVQVRDYRYSTGGYYNGEWLGGLRHGKGKMQWKDGAYYEGQWEYGIACGQGKFQHASGDVYVGNWYNNKCHGKGKYSDGKGASYDGDWKED